MIFLSTLDCNKGYHQIPLTLRSRKLTAFITEDGFFEFLRASFGLKNAPARFQRTIDAILGYCWDFVLAFIDDIIVFIPHVPRLRKAPTRQRSFHPDNNSNPSAFLAVNQKVTIRLPIRPIGGPIRAESLIGSLEASGTDIDR